VGNDKFELPVLDVPAPQNNGGNKQSNNKNDKKNVKKSGKQRRSIGKVFRDIISELKKVSWAPFKTVKGGNGVLAKTGTVLIVVLFFMLVIAGMDAGLGQLLKLLLNAAKPK